MNHILLLETWYETCLSHIMFIINKIRSNLILLKALQVLVEHVYNSSHNEVFY